MLGALLWEIGASMAFAEEKICNACPFKGMCPSENKKEVYELCETIKK